MTDKEITGLIVILTIPAWYTGWLVCFGIKWAIGRLLRKRKKVPIKKEEPLWTPGPVRPEIDHERLEQLALN